MLYIVSTPIGNIKDITLRAVQTLEDADLIAAEDTRRTKKITNNYQIKTPMTSYFEHNKLKKGPHIIDQLKKGKKVALVTDAGTPGISDPGYHLIQLAIKNNIEMTAVPGPTAFVAALSLSGLPTDRFAFEGFLPAKNEARKKRLEEYKNDTRTVIFYESPYRVLKALKDIQDVLEDPYVVCVREITKKYEEVKKGKCSELIDHFGKKKPRGEFVLLFNLKVVQ